VLLKTNRNRDPSGRAAESMAEPEGSLEMTFFVFDDSLIIVILIIIKIVQFYTTRSYISTSSPAN
jgi:hypothetical protein